MGELTVTSTSIIDSVNLDEVQAVMRKINTLQTIIHKQLVESHDYGKIPGVSKPTLFKPGGEKICMMFGINPEYSFLSTTEDYKNEFFSYNILCTLYKNGQPCAQGVGSCNSKEKKYRYINVDELPAGYVGASEQFTDSYGMIRYKIENPDICSLVNTILKMAKKRAFVDAVLQVASLSEIFTQDVEDMQEFVAEERKAATGSMTPAQAAAIKLRFGKHKGQTLKEVYTSDKSYMEWLMSSEKTDPTIRKACEIMFRAVKEQAQGKPTEAPTEPEAEPDEELYRGDVPFFTGEDEGPATLPY